MRDIDVEIVVRPTEFEYDTYDVDLDSLTPEETQDVIEQLQGLLNSLGGEY